MKCQHPSSRRRLAAQTSHLPDPRQDNQLTAACYRNFKFGRLVFTACSDKYDSSFSLRERFAICVIFSLSLIFLKAYQSADFELTVHENCIRLGKSKEFVRHSKIEPSYPPSPPRSHLAHSPAHRQTPPQSIDQAQAH